MEGENKARRGGCDLLLRLLAFALTLVSAILLGVDKQTKIVPIQIVSSLPPLHVPVTAKWQYQSAFVYLMVANIIASSYAVLSLLLSFTSMGGNNILELAIFVGDSLMVALLFSGSGASAAIGLVAYEGNSRVQWQKVCNVFGSFCAKVAASVLISMLGGVAFMLLVLYSGLRLHKRSSRTK